MENVILLDVNEASKLLRLAVPTLYKYVCARRVPFVKLNGRLLFNRQTLLDWIAENSVAPLSA